MSALVKFVPWLLVIAGLAIPLVLGGGAGWIYVVFLLIVLAIVWFVQPLTGASRHLRIQSAAICLVLLVFPGWVAGGLYLLPAALAWFVIAFLADPGSSKTA